MGMPLRDKKPPTNNPAASAAPSNEAPLPDTPEQGSAEDGSGFVPPPPVLPDGVFRCRFVKVNTWEKRDGTIAVNSKTGEPMVPAVTFEVSDPKEADKNKRGAPSCFGEEVSFKLDFTGRWYSQTVKYLTGMGVGPSTWPKGKVTPKNPGGQPSMAQLHAHINALAGREFVVTTKASAGKGDKKDQVYVNVNKVERYVPPARPAPKPSTPPPADEADTGSDDAGDDDSAD